MNSLHRRGAEEAEFEQGGLTESIIGAAIEVHSVLGPGLLESVYQQALQRELTLRAIPFSGQIEVPLTYKGEALPASLRLDLLVDSRVVVEIKSVASIEPVHVAQLLTYLKLARVRTGLLLNFNVVRLKDGIKRTLNPLLASASSAAPR